jgi:hypothetical protein
MNYFVCDPLGSSSERVITKEVSLTLHAFSAPGSRCNHLLVSPLAPLSAIIMRSSSELSQCRWCTLEPSKLLINSFFQDFIVVIKI